MSSIRRKLVIVGDGNCGKTSLLSVYINDNFSEDYVPTIFDTTVAYIEVLERCIILSLQDTAGQEDYDRLRTLSYPGTDVVVIVYSIDHRDSLLNVLGKWYPEVKHFCPGSPIILVGNKIDLRFDAEKEGEDKGRVRTQEGEMVAKKIGAFDFLECSARSRRGVKQVFETAAKAALQVKRRKKKKFSCTLF